MVFTGGRVVAGSKIERRSTIELLTTACTFPDHSSLYTSDCSTLCTSLALKTTMDKISMSLVAEPLLKTKTCLITILKPKERAASLKFPHQGENVRFFIWFPDQILGHSCDPMNLLGIANPLFEHVDVRAPGPAIFPKLSTWPSLPNLHLELPLAPSRSSFLSDPKRKVIVSFGPPHQNPLMLKSFTLNTLTACTASITRICTPFIYAPLRSAML